MARARGIVADLLCGFEGTFGQAAGSYYKLPFYSYGVGADQPFEEDPELGFGREPQEAARGALDVSGDIAVPMRMDALGFWLKALFGPPATTGTDPDFVHSFTSGADTLPSFTGEPKYQAAQFFQHLGLKANTLGVTLERSGSPRLSVGVLGAQELKATTSAAGTPTELQGEKAHNFQGTLKKDGSTFANITGFTFSWSNGLEAVPTVGDGGIVGAIDEGLPGLSGDMTARFADFTLFDLSKDNTPIEIELAWTIDADRYLKLTYHRARLSRPRQPIEGPGGVEASYQVRGEKDDSAGVAITAELGNGQDAYT